MAIVQGELLVILHTEHEAGRQEQTLMICQQVKA